MKILLLSLSFRLISKAGEGVGVGNDLTEQSGDRHEGAVKRIQCYLEGNLVRTWRVLEEGGQSQEMVGGVRRRRGVRS